MKGQGHAAHSAVSKLAEEGSSDYSFFFVLAYSQLTMLR